MVTVRAMAAADLAPVRGLMVQLGYDIDPTELENRLHAVTAAGDGHALMVAELDGTVVGLLHVFARPALEKPTEALVQSLVVDETCRGAGIGRALMTSAETWARERGLASAALHTQAQRADARAFYKSLGYEEVNQAMLLRKNLDGQ
jgi:GNAT superfamily N-acetyltransferase